MLIVQPGLIRLAAAPGATLLLVLFTAKLLEADYYRRRAEVEQYVVHGLVLEAYLARYHRWE